MEDYRTWEGDWELWSGIPVAMSPSADRVHQRLAFRIGILLHEALKGADCPKCEILSEKDWVAAADTVFRPDVLVVCDGGESKWIETAPRMVVEIPLLFDTCA